jgi:adenine-specific DNA-methyltransferase
MINCLEETDMLSFAETARIEASPKLDPATKSQLGQFMTPAKVAQFMASLFDKKHSEDIHLLEPSAGVGSLIAAFLENQVQLDQNITVYAYEIDRILFEYLEKNLTSCKNVLEGKGIPLNIELFHLDFIKDVVLKMMSGNHSAFTHAILNPPYKKINSDSDHRKLLRCVRLETVNLYSAFIGLSLLSLKEGGELVAIIPRSFCNGNYYKAFRNLILEKSAIKHIHLFESRIQAFKQDDVLQENVIIYLQKGVPQGDVTISLSEDSTLKNYTEKKYPFDQIVKTGDKEIFIHIPQHEANLLEDSASFNCTLKDLGLDVSTGPVVDFRTKENLLQDAVTNSVPLLYPVHFNGKEIEWPKLSKKPNAIAVNADTVKMLFPNGFYTVVRRFSSKEEKQRIIARVINPNKLDFDYIGIENHLNVFHFKKKGIAEDLAYGLAAYLNSAYVDTHFRTFNGHTQVNATDLRQMKYPSAEILKRLGQWAKRTNDFSQSKIDEQVREILRVKLVML